MTRRGRTTEAIKARTRAARNGRLVVCGAYWGGSLAHGDDDKIEIRPIPPIELPPLTPAEEAMWLTEHGCITTITRGGVRARVPDPDER